MTYACSLCAPYTRSLRDRAVIDPTGPGNTPRRLQGFTRSEAGIPDPTFVGPHVLRRSFATTFLASSPDKIYELKAALGHSRIDTTESYLAPVDRERVRDAVRSIEWFKSEDA